MAASSGAVPKWCSDRQLTVKCLSIADIWPQFAAICGKLRQKKKERTKERRNIYSLIIYIIFQSNDNTY